MGLYQHLIWLLLFLHLSTQQEAISWVGPGDIKPSDQTYNWNPEYHCRLLGHTSAILKTDDYHYLVFDGGMAKFRFNVGGKDTEVLDLNPWTVVIDLSRIFNTQDYGGALVSQTKRPLELGVPVNNRGGIWTDANQDSIYIQGGHFYDASPWNESAYYVNNTDIPPYSIWKFDIASKKWTDITKRGNNKDSFRRSVAGASASAWKLNQSFYVGGFVNWRTDKDFPKDVYTPRDGMVVYNHDDDTLTNATYGTAEEEGFGYWHGSLNYMKIGPGKGFLIALMGEKEASGVQRPDAPSVNDETGIPVDFDSVLFYSLDEQKWYKQKTTYFDDQRPETRCRFCAKTVYSKDTNTWELWVYGGQNVTNKGEGVDDIYVLSMPSFMWTTLKVTRGKEDQVRTHTCHAVGSQLLVVGGYPPGFRVEPDEPCASELVRVFDMISLSWTSYYRPDTIYRTPVQVKYRNGRDIIRSPDPKPWAASVLKDAFSYPPCTTTTTTISPPTDPTGGSGGGVPTPLGGLKNVLVVIFIITILQL